MEDALLLPRLREHAVHLHDQRALIALVLGQRQPRPHVARQQRVQPIQPIRRPTRLLEEDEPTITVHPALVRLPQPPATHPEALAHDDSTRARNAAPPRRAPSRRLQRP